ncbi:MAG: SPOR domain-containing protein [Flavobacteriales bacterium]|nr:SPOR domain-containing protein [Flavobacteriales bacterium]MCB9449265.1 SPOR domain-containing protein [Flavobacteriales bacterium]
MSIEPYIKQLLWAHDCVILPDFGGLVANESSARLLVHQRRLLPPGKQLSFNPVLRNNDGLLTDAVRQGEGVSYNEAKRLVADVLTSWKERLQKGERIRVDEVGRFYMNAAGKILFEPSGEVHFAKSSFGLTPVVAVARAREIPQPVITSVQETKAVNIIERSITPQPEKKEITVRRIRRISDWKVAAVVPVFIVMGAFLAWTISQFGSPQPGTDFSSLEMTVPQEDSVVPQTSSPESDVTTAPVEDHQAEAVSDEKKEDAPPAQPAPVESQPIQAPPKENRFHLIGGCFRSKRNAEKKLKELRKQGYDASIAGQNERGLYRVSLEGFTTREAAEARLEALRAEHQSAWLLSL